MFGNSGEILVNEAKGSIKIFVYKTICFCAGIALVFKAFSYCSKFFSFYFLYFFLSNYKVQPGENYLIIEL